MSRWNWYWLIWACITFAAFIGPEIYALATNWRNTLSASVWQMEKYAPDQSLSKWTALHFLFIGMLLLIFLWLIGHFGWGLWR